MQRLISFVLFIACAGAAGAHNLPTDAGIVAGLGHQLSAAHHWPLLLTILVVVLVAGVGSRLTRRR